VRDRWPSGDGGGGVERRSQGASDVTSLEVGFSPQWESLSTHT
jgi:hypothetical protein